MEINRGPKFTQLLRNVIKLGFQNFIGGKIKRGPKFTQLLH